MFTEISQQVIQGINLIFFIPTSMVAIYMNVKNKNIDYRVSKIIIISGIIGATTPATIPNIISFINSFLNYHFYS